jgi:ribosomal protein S6--L-glutamate ligase
MKIAVLSRNESLYSTRRLVEAAAQRGHEVEVIDYLRCYMNISAQTPSIHYLGKALPQYDAVIPRIGARRTFYGAALLRQIETMGMYTVNPSIAITRSRDKLRSLQILSMHNVEMPLTAIAQDPNDTADLLKPFGKPPIIIKLIEGTQGMGVVLAETRKAAESVIQAFRGLHANIIVQEFIAEAAGTDLRCIVLGEKVIASMIRKAEGDNFRSNLHQGGTAEEVKITKEERHTAITAAKVLGLKFAGVDLLRSHRGPLVMEVNSSPGLEGIEKATQKDVASLLIEYIEKYAKPNLNVTRYQG